MLEILFFYVIVGAAAGPDPRRAPRMARQGRRGEPSAQGRAPLYRPRAPAEPDPRRAPGEPRALAGPHQGPGESPGEGAGERRGGPMA